MAGTERCPWSARCQAYAEAPTLGFTRHMFRRRAQGEARRRPRRRSIGAAEPPSDYLNLTAAVDRAISSSSSTRRTTIVQLPAPYVPVASWKLQFDTPVAVCQSVADGAWFLRTTCHSTRALGATPKVELATSEYVVSI